MMSFKITARKLYFSEISLNFCVKIFLYTFSLFIFNNFKPTVLILISRDASLLI